LGRDDSCVAAPHDQRQAPAHSDKPILRKPVLANTDRVEGRVLVSNLNKLQSGRKSMHPNTKVLAGSRRRIILLGWAAALLGTTALLPSPSKAATPSCSALAAQVLTNPDISAATSAVQPAAGANLSYCLVNITYSHLAGPMAGYLPGQSQTVKIGIGLPLSTADGGSGGVQGNWNGRIEDLGGGGYVGSVGSVTGATNLGNVGSSTDTGHTGGTPLFALNSNGTLNWGLINDFAYNGIHAQAVWSKKLTLMYYGMPQKYAYWVGCSEGGHQANIQAQRYPYDYNGILAGHPVFHLDVLQPQQLWGQVVSNVELGGPISNNQLTAVAAAAIASCQNTFGGTPDGIIQDPRACLYNATSYICGAPTATINGVPDTTNCLTPAEAAVVNKIWAGITNDSGVGGGAVLYPGQDEGAPITGLSGSSLPPFSVPYFEAWVFQNLNFNWKTFTEQTYQQAILLSEQKFRPVQADDDPDLSRFRNAGGKMILYHGGADQLVPSRGSYAYYNNVTARDGSLATTQSYFRFFPIPGNNHCGGTSLAPSQSNAPIENTTDLLTALENWVENGQAPATIIGYNNMNHALATVTRPWCMYPNTLSYNGSGSIFSASNFTCVTQTSDPLQYTDAMAADIGPTIRYLIAPTHDFSYLKNSDILFRDSSGNVGAWLMSAATASGAPASIAQGTVIGNVGLNWSVVGQRDLVGQGDSSILWRDTAGDAAIWAMNGTNVAGIDVLSPVPTNWFVAATGAFYNNQSQNQQGGILWEDNNGNLAVSETSDGQIVSTLPVGQLPANWVVVGADLNGWIFMRNTVSGDVGIWVMNGATVTYAVDLGSVPANWKIAGIGDFNGDGYSDVLWRDNLGNVGIWIMGLTPTGITIASAMVLGNVPTTWTIVQTGDYNGDGFSDILWMDNLGNIGAWFMKGTSIASTIIYGNIGTSWTVQAQAAE
jgi:hypothetical protein